MAHYEWDRTKAAANLARHGIDFEDAVAIFDGPVLEVRSDRRGEPRWKVLGEIGGVVIAVVYTWRSDRRRIISARKASKDEREAYRTARRRGSA